MRSEKVVLLWAAMAVGLLMLATSAIHKSANSIDDYTLYQPKAADWLCGRRAVAIDPHERPPPKPYLRVS